jgi:hypothetical protein
MPAARSLPSAQATSHPPEPAAAEAGNDCRLPVREEHARAAGEEASGPHRPYQEPLPRVLTKRPGASQSTWRHLRRGGRHRLCGGRVAAPFWHTHSLSGHHPHEPFDHLCACERGAVLPGGRRLSSCCSLPLSREVASVSHRCAEPQLSTLRSQCERTENGAEAASAHAEVEELARQRFEDSPVLRCGGKVFGDFALAARPCRPSAPLWSVGEARRRRTLCPGGFHICTRALSLVVNMSPTAGPGSSPQESR